MGNQTAQSVRGVTTNFTLNNDDELTATSGAFVNSYSYNLNGEQTGRTLSGTAYTLAYDFEGQLTSTTQGGNTTSFAYDALGRRHTRTAGGTTTRFIPGPGGILLEKQGSNYTAVYTHGNAQVRKDSEYPMYDGIGSERTITASNQSVSGTITFEGFGQTIATTGSSANPYMFKGAWGYRNDADAGLTHVGARFYDAQVGRFITRDTYLDQHPYLYCEHNPINMVDPSGHIAWVLVALIVADLIIQTGSDDGPPTISPPGQFIEFAGPLVGAVLDEEYVSEVLKKKKGSITRQPLEEGSPSWDDLRRYPVKIKDIVAGAAAKLPGYRTIKKLLQSVEYDR